MVAEINYVVDAGLQAVAGRCFAGRHGHDAFGPDTGARAVLHFGGIDIQAGQAAAAGQFQAALVAAGLHQAAIEDGVVADETGHKTVRRRFIEMRHGVDLLDHAVVEHGHAVRHGQGLGLVVGDVDEGQPELAVQFLEFELHVLAQLLVQRTQRLVHQHQLRVKHQGAGQRHTLLLAAR